jgi:hypothetical protein
MFRKMWNRPKSGTVLAEATDCICRRLPPGWSVAPQAGRRTGALELRGAHGPGIRFEVLVRKGLTPSDIPALALNIGEPTLVVSRHLGARVRELLAQASISYADATGNLRLVANKPALFLEAAGSDRDPERKPRPLHSLRGAAAGRVVRALCEFAPPFGVRALAAAAATPLGTVSRVVSYVETEALLSRNDRKQILTIDWEHLLNQWAKHYGVATTNTRRSYIEPRGLSALWPKLARLPRYAITGSSGATGVAPTRLAMIYVDDLEDAARELELVATEAGANVWLLQPYDDIVFERTRLKQVPSGTSTTELVTVSFPQTVVDLLTSPGRGPQEAAALVQEMKEPSNVWQRIPRP